MYYGERLNSISHLVGAVLSLVGFGALLTVSLQSYDPWIIAGFVVFRLLDITKPWPIGVLDKKVKGGFGIMIDDIIAGIMACALLHLVRFLV